LPVTSAIRAKKGALAKQRPSSMPVVPTGHTR
jgi:hypothetical protein